jgi:glutathione peroxidase
MSESTLVSYEPTSGTLLDVPLVRLDGSPTSLRDLGGELFLVVNVASECGLTPQYAGLQRLHETYAPRGLTVVGCPCNQFGEQEPGSPEQIGSFCTTNYGVSFPLLSKLEVNGPGRHPLFATLSESVDADGRTGDIVWNFEKFVVSRNGDVVARFNPSVEPEAPALIETIEANLPAV